MPQTHRDAFRSLIASGDLAAAVEFLTQHPISGADGEPEPIYPEIPDDVAGLTDDELADLEERTVELVRRAQARDDEIVGQASDGNDLVEQTKKAVAGVKRIREEKETRATAEAELDAELDATIGEILSGEPATEPATDPATVEPEPAAEPVAAAEPELDPAVEPEPVAAAAPRRPPLPRRRAPQHQPRPAGRRSAAITAAAEIPGFPLGSELKDLTAVAAAIIARKRQMGPSSAADRVIVASIQRPLDESRTLRADDDEGNVQKIEAVCSPTAIAAAGGICVMPEPLYDVPTFGVDDTPVVDSLPVFNADRGGISFYPPVGFGEINTAVGVITNAEASAGGTNALKTCQAMTCPPTVTKFVDSVYRCIEVDNLGALTFPERLAAFVRNSMIAWAQARELEALATIDAASIPVTYTLGAGAMSSVIGALGVQAASLRSHQRLAPDAPMRVIFPAWAPDFLLQDVVRQGFDPDRYGFGRDRIVNFLRTELNLNPVFALDLQPFAAQSAGGSLTWGSSGMTTYLYPEGSFLHLNTGNLDLGLVRDSSLNQRNHYQVFAETFETNVFRGVESRKVTITSDATGQVGVNASATLTAHA